jgi:predicted nucleic acid-binding protein
MDLKSVFIDANIFIDVNDNTRKTYEQSFKIIPYLLSNNIKIFTSCDLITIIYYILSRKSKEEALLKIEQLNKICTIIDFSNSELLQTTNMMREDKSFKDLEDAIQYVLALNTKCDCIISNDKGFYSPDIKLFSSDGFIEEFRVR